MKVMMKKIMLILLLAAGSIGSMAQKKVIINGTVKTDTKEYNKIYTYGNGVKADSALIKNGKFSISVPFEKPFMVLMYAEYTVKSGMMYTPYGLLIDRPGVINIDNIDLNTGMETGKVSGLGSAVLYRKFNQDLGEQYKKVNDGLNKKFGKYWVEEKDPQYESFEKEKAALSKKYVGKFVEQFVAGHPDSYVSVVALSGARSVLPLEEQETLYGKLSKKMQQSEDGKDIIDFIQGSRGSAIGSYVKDFTLNTPAGKPIAFSSFKGKYVIIDFWASWCGPCKQSFPHMKEVYKNYKSDQFEIYSISIDKDKEAWLKAVEEQQFPWEQALDTKNIAHKGFAVTGVPTTYLIDPAGKILMKEVGFDPGGNSGIEKKLAELFGNKMPVKQAEEKKDDSERKAIPATRLQ